MPKALDTAARRKNQNAKDRATKRLIDRGWKYDGLWWHSPYTQTRYGKREAMHVEELREWAEGDSAFLNDHDHSMWVKKEIDDNQLISMEELSERSAKRSKLLKNAKDGCYK